MARHTFATTVTLGNGVPIESVSKMMGHTNIKTTQIYARITDQKVNNDMAVLASKLDGHYDDALPEESAKTKHAGTAAMLFRCSILFLSYLFSLVISL